MIPVVPLDDGDLSAVRALMDLVFTDYTDDDWGHARGGTHHLVRDGDAVIAFGAVASRRVWVGERALRCGYVGSVAVHPQHRRRGHAATVMTALESHCGEVDLLALKSSPAGEALYESRGWLRWRGRASVLTPAGPTPTPAADGTIFVLPVEGLDLDAPITCDWRPGDVW